MKYLLILLILTVVFESDVLAKRRKKAKHHPKKSHQHHSKHGGGKIVGGNEVSIQDCPYMAYFFIDSGGEYGFECGGSILSSQYILSAAHCFEDNPLEVTATIGTANKLEGGRHYRGSYTIHEDYDADTLDYDIAFFKSHREMHLDGVHSAGIGLIEEGTSIPSGTMLKISGWGDTSVSIETLIEKEDGDDSDTLLATEVPTISNEECNAKPNAFVTARQFCGGFEEGGKDHCEGDSGGPAVIADSNILAGVVSGSFGDCAAPDTPGVYVNLTEPAIRSWILQHTGL